MTFIYGMPLGSGGFFVGVSKLTQTFLRYYN